jgi:hypothetical protein
MGRHRDRGGYHLENFQKVLDFTVSRMDTRNYTLQVWQTFGDLHEFALKGRVIHQILYRIESETNSQLENYRSEPRKIYRALISETSRRGMHSQMRNNRFPELTVQIHAGRRTGSSKTDRMA